MRWINPNFRFGSNSWNLGRFFTGQKTLPNSQENIDSSPHTSQEPHPPFELSQHVETDAGHHDHDHIHDHGHDHDHHQIHGEFVCDHPMENLPTHDPAESLWQSLKRHAWNNLPIESLCILSCEAGELSGEFVSYTLGFSHSNEIGLATGIIAGLTYAVYHVTKDHKGSDHESCDHNHGFVLKTWRDVALYVAAAETGCVVAASSVEYGFGKFLGTTAAPWEPENLAIRLIGLPVAFVTGLAIMSATTYALEKWNAFRD